MRNHWSEMILYSHANKTLFHKERFRAYPSIFGTRKILHLFKSFYVILGPAIGPTFFQENLRVLKTKKKRFCKILPSLNFEYIYYTY